MITAHAYNDSVYLNKGDLYQFEGVRAQEAEPCHLPDELPEQIYRVDGGTVLVDGALACLAFEKSRGRIVLMELTPDKRRYTARAIMEGPRFLQARAELAGILGVSPEGLEMR